MTRLIIRATVLIALCAAYAQAQHAPIYGVGAGTITADKIATDAVGSDELAANSVGTSEVNFNYVASAATTAPIAGGAGGSEGAALTFSLNANGVDASHLAGTLTFADADLLDLAAILGDDTALQGLRLPQAAGGPSANPVSGEGFLAYDTTGDKLRLYTGAAWADVGTTYSAGNDLDLTGTTFDLETVLDTPTTWNIPSGAAMTAGNYQIGRDADGTNQLHFNVPTGAGFELSVNDVAEATLSATSLNLQNNTLDNIGAAGTDFSATGGLTLADTLTISAGQTVGTALTHAPGVGVNGVLVNLGGTLTEAASGTHARMMGLSITAPTLSTAGGATTTDASSVYISGAPSGATRNYGLWIDSGWTRFDGPLDLGAGAAFDTTRVQMGRNASDNMQFNMLIGGLIDWSFSGTSEMNLTPVALTPGTNDGLALGNSSSPLGWSDLFLASGSVIDFAAGDVTITHATDRLTFGGSPVNLLVNATPDDLYGNVLSLFVSSNYVSQYTQSNSISSSFWTGFYSEPENTSTNPGASKNMVGFTAAPETSAASGTIGALRGFIARASVSNAGGTATDVIGYSMEDAISTGTITNQYGIKLPRLAGGDTLNRGYHQDLQTAGTMMQLSADSAAALTGTALTGINVDLNTSVTATTDVDVTNLNLLTPTLTQSAANTTNFRGLNLATAGALVQDTAAGTLDWRGANIQMPNITQTTGTVNSYGLYVNGGTVTSGTQYAAFVDSGITRLDGDVDIDSGTGLVRHNVTEGITASTTQTQGQGALTAEVNEVATVANTNDTVTLPSAVAGYRVVVINNGANTLQIFPASGDNLGVGVDTATTLAAGSNVVYQAYNATNWESI